MKNEFVITFTCRECGFPCTLKKTIWDKRRRETGKDPQYCSKPCTFAGRKRATAMRKMK